MADRSVKIVVGAQVTGVVNGMRTAKGAVEDFSKSADKSFQRNRASLDDLAGTATKVGLALGGMAVFAGKAAMDWESAWAGVTKTVDGSAKQMATLEGQLRDLATTLPATHQEIAAVAEAAGQLGVAREDVAAFTRTMIDLGETTNLTSDEAATSIAQLMNVMQTAPGDVDNLASSLVALGNDGASTERDIIMMAQNLAGAGATVGLAETDVLGLANALASVGIEAEAGGSSVSKILIDMAKAAKTGSADLETWASTAGMATDEFAALIAQDPAQAFDAFTQGLGRINAEGGDVFTLLKNLGQSDVRVTRALLGMANAGDLLSDSLSLGASSWQENSALAEEAAKRYDTTAAQAQVAWNNIKDNAIDAGQAILPVVSGISDVVVTLADAFGSLPGPVKSSMGLLAGGTGGLLLAAAAFTKMYGAVSDTREAFTKLSASSPRLASGLKAAAGAAGVVTGAFIAMNAVFETLDRDSAASVEEMTAAILDFSDGAKGLDANLSNSRGLLSMATGASELEATIKEAWKGTDGFNAAMSKTFSLGGAFGALNPYGDALEDVKVYDQAFTSMVNSGATEQAAAGAAEFAKSARAAGLGAKDVERLLPGYTAALKDVDNQSRIAASGTKEFEQAQAQASEEQEKAKDAARKQASAFTGLGNSLNDAKVSLGDWISELAQNARALENFTTNSVKAAKRGLDDGLIASLQEAGPEGARRMAQLAGATEKEIGRANSAWRRGEAAIENYANKLSGVPTTKTTRINVDTGNAIRLIQDVRTQVDRLTGKTITIGIRTVGSPGTSTVNADGGFHQNGVKTFADGGVDERGNRVERTPQIRSGSKGTVMWGEAETGWEAYVSGKPSQKPRNRAILSEAAGRLGGSVQWFADGGFTEAVSSREYTSMRIRVRDLKRSLRETEKYGKGGKKRRLALRGLDRLEARQELREAEAELAEQARIRRNIGKGKKYRTAGQYNRAMQSREDAAEKRRDDAQSAKDDRSSTARSFADGLGSDAFKSPASLERALANMLRDGAEHTQLLAQLKKAGASPWLLEQLIKAGPSRSTNRTARALLADTAKLKRINAMSNGIVSTANQFAALTTGKGFEQTFSGGANFDYNALARALSQVQINAPLIINGRQAGALVQEGQKHVGSNA